MKCAACKYEYPAVEVVPAIATAEEVAEHKRNYKEALKKTAALGKFRCHYITGNILVLHECPSCGTVRM